MDTFSAIEQRRSVKHFDPEHNMSEEEKTRILELAALSPTAFNIQHWRFVVVEDEKLRAEIRANAWNQAQVTDSSLFIILCADMKAWEKNPARYWVNTAQEVQDFLVPAIGEYYSGKDQVQRDNGEKLLDKNFSDLDITIPESAGDEAQLIAKMKEQISNMNAV